MNPTTLQAAEAARVFTQTLADALTTVGKRQVPTPDLDMELVSIRLVSETSAWEAAHVIAAAKDMAHAIEKKDLRTFWRLPLPGGLEGFACDAGVVPVRVLSASFSEEGILRFYELWFDVVGQAAE